MTAVPDESVRTGGLRVPTIVEEIVRNLRAMILRGEYRPGERLIEEQLAEHFGVSRPPVREALRVLSTDGLVTSEPRKGFTVISLSPRDVVELYDLRFALERTAVELAVPVGDPGRLEGMRAAIETMRGAVAQADPDAMLAANTDFHIALVSLPGNRRLNDAYASLSMQLTVCMAMNLKFREQLHHDPRDAVRRHEALLGLIEAGDLDAVLVELRNHGDRSFMDRLDELIDPPVPAH